MDGRQSGAIKKLITETHPKRRAFGFILGDDGEERFFIPSSLEVTQAQIWEDLREGDRVTFVEVTHQKGTRAVEVRVLA